MTDFSNTDDLIDIRDIFEKIGELEDLIESRQFEIDEIKEDTNREIDDELDMLLAELSDTESELNILTEFISDFAGYGGDEEYNGEWYPGTLVRDSYWNDYCKETCEEIGDIPNNLPSYIEIDWERTAENIQIDYSSGEYDGVTYWGRNS